MADTKEPTHKRTGDCNCCGDCCRATALICEEEGIREFLSHRGINNKEQIVTVLLTPLGPDKVKITLFEKCDALVDTPGLPPGDEEARCSLVTQEGDMRMPKCRRWPTKPDHLKHVPRCSYGFK